MTTQQVTWGYLDGSPWPATEWPIAAGDAGGGEQQFLINPEFDDGTEGWQPYLGDIEVAAGVLTATWDGVGDVAGASQDLSMAVESSVTVTVRARIRTPAGRNSVLFLFHDIEQEDTWGSELIDDLTPEAWEDVEATVTVPADRKLHRLYVAPIVEGVGEPALMLGEQGQIDSVELIRARSAWTVEDNEGSIAYPEGSAAEGLIRSRFDAIEAWSVEFPYRLPTLTNDGSAGAGAARLRIWLRAQWDPEQDGTDPTDGYFIETIWNVLGETKGVASMRVRRRVAGNDTTISSSPGIIDPDNPPPVLSVPLNADDPAQMIHFSIDQAGVVRWGGWPQGQPRKIFEEIVEDSPLGAGAFLITAETFSADPPEVDWRIGTLTHEDLTPPEPDPDPDPEPPPPLPPIIRPPAGPLIVDTLQYELVAVQRIPALSGLPTYVELDQVPFGGLAWGQELNRPDDMQVGVKPSRLASSIRERLRSLHDHPTELWLYRNGQIVAAGPIIGYQVQGETLTLQARGRLYYTRGYILAKTHAWEDEDQHFIAKALIDYWQSYAYGNFGIDTSNVTASGTRRQRTYDGAEAPIIYELLEDLCNVLGGPDMHVDPASGEFLLWTPARGEDRTGVDGVFIDSRNIASPNIEVSVAPEDFAAQTFATTTDEQGGNLIRSSFDSERAATYGRVGYRETFHSVETATALQAHADALLAARAEQLLQPSAQLIPVPNCEVEDFDVGDTLVHTYDYGLGPVSGPQRAVRKQVVVEDDGREKISVSFA